MNSVDGPAPDGRHRSGRFQALTGGVGPSRVADPHLARPCRIYARGPAARLGGGISDPRSVVADLLPEAGDHVMVNR